jgi:hypothetical protein
MHSGTNEEAKEDARQCQRGSPIHHDELSCLLAVEDGSETLPDAGTPYQTQDDSI